MDESSYDDQEMHTRAVREKARTAQRMKYPTCIDDINPELEHPVHTDASVRGHDQENNGNQISSVIA
jgi:hypothetical protein